MRLVLELKSSTVRETVPAYLDNGKEYLHCERRDDEDCLCADELILTTHVIPSNHNGRHRKNPRHHPSDRMPVISTAPLAPNILSDDDDGWQDMPVVLYDYLATDLGEDRKTYHYKAPSADAKATYPSNATGNLIDFDDRGYEWRYKAEVNEIEYTRLRMTEDEESDEVAPQTKYLFDEDAAMTPLNQMQATKGC
jgi:hypothetical protein